MIKKADGNELESLTDGAKEARQRLIRSLVMRLDGGKRDREAALELMRMFRNHGTSQPLPPDMYDWLSSAFGNVIEGMDADTALGSKRGKGERKHFAIDEIAIACCVELSLRKGLSRAESIDAAVEYYNRERRTIENAVSLVALDEGVTDEELLLNKLKGSNRKA
jgi:hypothetical protein